MSMYLKFRIGKDKRKLVPINGFELNDADSNNPQWIQGRQNEDGGRQVFVDLEDEDGSPVNLTGANAIFKGVLPGGEYKIWDHKHSTIIDAQAGRFRYTFPKRAMAIAGSYKQAFFEIYREGNKLATLEFNFEVLADLVEENIIPSDYITPFEDLYGKLKEYLVKFNGDFETAMTQWKKDVADLITELNADVSGINLTITEIKTQLSTLEDKIKADGLLTQADLDKALEPISDLMNELNGLSNLDISIDGGVVEPFKSNLSNFASTINTDDNVARIGLLQDIHYQRAVYKDYGQAVTRGLLHIQHVGMLKDYLDMAVYNGDNVHGRETKDNTIRRVKQLVSTHRLAFGDIPTLWTIGNHDDNNIYFQAEQRVKNIINLSELESALQIDKTYGYHDLNDKKLRVIVLNDFENPEIVGENGLPKYTRDYNSVFSATQIKWLIDALKVPTGYSVVIFTHAPLVGFYNNKPYANYTNVNHDVVLGVIKAYVNGSSYTADGTNTDYPVSVNVDYSNQGKGLFVGMVFGHEHWDGEIQTVDGIRGIERTCNLAANRNLNEIDEDAFDVVEIDTANKHCRFNRFGSGNSLEFDY
ncbi:BppU family phage baseplate upper protein [Pediococcus acidilactici]|uniref:BppU family phage baseplate upper protein n=1 Tax=Pediococcus acidilactici TaxID=1254 RepID=UPI001BD61C79|nr:BppU family phage baseplate upper protein [Pediococcus acidilactici]MBS9400011.1 BppU family phage baseplate upper protein [Pediococcus acidilactici]